MTWTLTSDVTSRWVGDEPPAPSDPVIAVWISDAETLVAHSYPDLQDRIDGGDLPLGTVVMVVARMVIRALRNPDNTRSEQVQTGPFGRTRTFAGDNPGGLFLTDDDRELLGGDAAIGGQRAFSIDTTPAATRNATEGYWSSPSTWVPL